HLSRSEIIPLVEDCVDRHACFVVVADEVPNGDPSAFDDRLASANAINLDDMCVGSGRDSVLRSHGKTSAFKTRFNVSTRATVLPAHLELANPLRERSPAHTTLLDCDTPRAFPPSRSRS